MLAFPADTNIVWKSHDDSIAQRSAIDQARQEKAHHHHHHHHNQHHAGADRRRTTTVNDDSTGNKGKGTASWCYFLFLYIWTLPFFFPRRVVYSKGLKRKKAKNKNKNKKHKQNEHSLGCVLGLGYWGEFYYIWLSFLFVLFFLLLDLVPIHVNVLLCNEGS